MQRLVTNLRCLQKMKRSEVRNVYKTDFFLIANINVLCKQKIKN